MCEWRGCGVMATTVHRIPALTPKETPAQEARRLFAARIDDRCKFWMSSGGWPWDPTGYVFLARAVQEIGKAMYGAEWTGAEPCTPIPWDHRTGNGREAISRLEVRAVTQGGLDDFRQAVADFRQAVAEIANKRAEADKVALRLAAVQNYIV